MWVDPAARRTGVVHALLKAIATWARGYNAEHLQLWVSEGNTSAIALYERFGFLLTGDAQPVVPTDPARLELAMRMSLPGTSPQ